ncbi:MAG: glycosyltransferase family 2 protein [Clostridia bacterium]|nr:glycosyltransferase family 2 protein [Clostridia bacterium]
MEKRLVSVIIPTYKRSSYLLGSINSVLAQTYGDVEVIVIDDNGDDSPFRVETEKRMECFANDKRVKYIKLKHNCGGAIARNVGIDIANGEYITFLDDDDIYLPDKVKIQVQAMRKYGWDLSIMDLETYNQNGELLTKKTQMMRNGMSSKELMATHLMYHLTGTPTMMFKADALRRIGGFVDVVAAQEFMLMLKAIEQGLFIGYINKVSVKAYIRDGERISTSEKKLIGERLLYKAKKNRFSYLNCAQRRFVTCRHFGVLFYVQLKRKKYISAFFYLLLTVCCSPRGSYGIYEEYKGKLK